MEYNIQQIAAEVGVIEIEKHATDNKRKRLVGADAASETFKIDARELPAKTLAYAIKRGIIESVGNKFNTENNRSQDKNKVPFSNIQRFDNAVAATGKFIGQLVSGEFIERSGGSRISKVEQFMRLALKGTVPAEQVNELARQRVAANLPTDAQLNMAKQLAGEQPATADDFDAELAD